VNNAVLAELEVKAGSFSGIPIRNRFKGGKVAYEGKTYPMTSTTVPELLRCLKQVPKRHLRGLRRIEVGSTPEKRRVSSYSGDYRTNLERQGRTEVFLLGYHDARKRVVYMLPVAECPAVIRDYPWAFYHEVGHSVWAGLTGAHHRVFAALARRVKEGNYGSVEPEEAFCEAYAAYLSDGVVRHDVLEFMRKQVFLDSKAAITAKSVRVYDDFVKSVAPSRSRKTEMPVKKRTSRFKAQVAFESSWAAEYRAMLLHMTNEILEIMKPEEEVLEEDE
jgi:hypothetical protein